MGIEPLAIVFLLLTRCLLAILRETLGDLSLGKLDQAIRDERYRKRFDEITKLREKAYHTCRVLGTVVTVALVLVWAKFYHLSDLANESDWSLVPFVGNVLGLLAVLWITDSVCAWSFARVVGEGFVLRVWRPIRWVTSLATPLTAFASYFDTVLHRVYNREPSTTADTAQLKDELQTYVTEGQREGSLGPVAGRMIQRVIRLNEGDAASIMTSRMKMVCLTADATIEEAARTFREEGRSRIPIIGDSPDEILGILYAKDLLIHAGTSRLDLFGFDHTNGSGPEFSVSGSVRNLPLREPLRVPESMSIETLLGEMRDEHKHLAIVFDEYGGVAGLVTMEDILEEIVGEIEDEYDPEVPTEAIRDLGNGVTEVDAQTNLLELGERLGVEFPEGDYETIAGFVISELGRLPDEGNYLDWNGYRLIVAKANERRVDLLRIESNIPMPHPMGE